MLEATKQPTADRNYKWTVLAVTSIGVLAQTIDIAAVIVSFPKLAETFAVPPSTILWLTVSFWLGCTSLMLTLGKVSDIFGRKKLYIWGFAIFTIGMGLCALSQNVWQLISFRFLQAIGAAMAVANLNAIITDVFPARERGKALGVSGLAVWTGVSIGPFIGGLLLDSFGWQAMFYLRVPTGLISLLAALALRDDIKANVRASFDVKGAVILFGVLASLLLGINQWATRSLNSPIALSLIVLASLLLALLILVEKQAASPIVDLNLFKNRLFSSATAAHMLNFMTNGAVNFLMPFYLIQGGGYSTATAGLLLVAYPLGTLLATPVSGWLSDRMGWRGLWAAGQAMCLVSLLLLARLGNNPSPAIIVLFLVVGGIGMGMFWTPNSSLIMGVVPQSQLGTASALTATLRQTGMALGMIIVGTVFTSRQSFYASQPAFYSAATQTEPLIGAFRDALLVTAVFALITMMLAVVRDKRRISAVVEQEVG